MMLSTSLINQNKSGAGHMCPYRQWIHPHPPIHIYIYTACVCIYIYRHTCVRKPGVRREEIRGKVCGTLFYSFSFYYIRIQGCIYCPHRKRSPIVLGFFSFTLNHQNKILASFFFKPLQQSICGPLFWSYVIHDLQRDFFLFCFLILMCEFIFLPCI